MGRQVLGGLAVAGLVAVLAAIVCARPTERPAGESYGPPPKVVEEPAESGWVEVTKSGSQSAETEAETKSPQGSAEGESPRASAEGESSSTIGEASEEAAIAASVKKALTEGSLDNGNVTVMARPDGTVTLKGQAVSEEQKRAVEQAVLEVEGVSSVENGLTLAP